VVVGKVRLLRLGGIGRNDEITNWNRANPERLRAQLSHTTVIT